MKTSKSPPENQKNFSGGGFRGQSFKNQDLSGVDFSYCDLRGVNFSESNLTEAKFCQAQLGKTVKTQSAIFFLQLLVGILASSMFFIGTVILSEISKDFLQISRLTEAYHLPILITVNAILISFVTLLAIEHRRFDYLFWYWSILVAVCGATTAVTPPLIYSPPIFLSLGLGLLLAAILIIVVTGGVLAIALGGATTGIAALFLPVIMLIGNIASVGESNHGSEAPKMLAVTGGSIINVILGIYLSRRALNKQEPQLQYLRQLIINFHSLGGTQFAFANLTDTDFYGADIKYARFSDALINRCCFGNTINHHLAQTRHTPLESNIVRSLVIDGIVLDKNLANLDLHGLVFSGLNLQSFDFSHANLCGADLSHTKMTGAILEGWNIDTETILEGINCKYYYYLEDGEKKRMPPEGEEYKPGEFTRIFQKIANTIDFIAHNEMELAAIKLSVEQVRVESGNDDIRVQAVEEKNGFIVVKVTVPKTEDRGILYHEVNSLKQEYEAKIQVLMAENDGKLWGLQGNIDNLKEQLKEQRQDLLAAIKEQNLIQIQHVEEITMGNTTTIIDSTINNNGVMNLGEINGNVSQTIQRLPSDQSELKILLSQLQSLINDSTLKPDDKQEALTETKTIAEAANKSDEEKQSTVRKTLRYFKGLAEELKDLPETAPKIRCCCRKNWRVIWTLKP